MRGAENKKAGISQLFYRDLLVLEVTLVGKPI